MRFLGSTLLLMCLSLETLTSITRTYSGGTNRPGKLAYNFSISNDSTQIWLTFLPGSQTVVLTVLLFYIYFFLLTLVFALQ